MNGVANECVCAGGGGGCALCMRLTRVSGHHLHSELICSNTPTSNPHNHIFARTGLSYHNTSWQPVLVCRSRCSGVWQHSLWTSPRLPSMAADMNKEGGDYHLFGNLFLPDPRKFLSSSLLEKLRHLEPFIKDLGNRQQGRRLLATVFRSGNSEPRTKRTRIFSQAKTECTPVYR